MSCLGSLTVSRTLFRIWYPPERLKLDIFPFKYHNILGDLVVNSWCLMTNFRCHGRMIRFWIWYFRIGFLIPSPKIFKLEFNVSPEQVIYGPLEMPSSFWFWKWGCVEGFWTFFSENLTYSFLVLPPGLEFVVVSLSKLKREKENWFVESRNGSSTLTYLQLLCWFFSAVYDSILNRRRAVSDANGDVDLTRPIDLVWKVEK